MADEALAFSCIKLVSSYTHACVLIQGTYTVGLSNPMVAFGVACVSEDFTNHWIYWVGPLIGGPLGAYLYKIFVYMNRSFTPQPKVEQTVAKQSLFFRFTDRSRG